MPSVAIIDGPYLTYRAWCAGGGDKAALIGASIPLIVRYLARAAEVYVVWEQPGQRGLDFRRKIDPGYKSSRAAKPHDYYDALAELQRALPWLDVHQAWPKDGEADDAAATLTRQARERGATVELWALDHDWLQLVAPGVTVHQPKQPRRPARTITTANIVELTGGNAAWHLNLMSLAGDPGDDIPGLPKIGKGRAQELLRLCPTIVQGILAYDTMAVERQVAARAPQMLRWAQVAMEHADLLRDTRRLVTMHDVPLMMVDAAGDLDRATEWLAKHGLERHLEAVRNRLDPDPWTVEDPCPPGEPWELEQ